MAKHKPRHIVVDGQPMVALTSKEYGEPAAKRRQVGGMGSRLRVVRDELVALSGFLEALVRALEAEGTSARRTDPDSQVQALLATAPRLLGQARGIAGRRRGSPAPRPGQ
ncbi:hypothetical protein ACIRP2_26810 [Streptomyces sp. NPDC101194]|uniref:hypothetical protein n=1 Tax=Streptomyces sp. NPDC101194 TaxID=3366127 RepID=UPI00380CC859